MIEPSPEAHMPDRPGATPPDAPAASAPRMTCERLVAAITEYLEGAMAPEDQSRLEMHLSFCPPCQIYLEQMKVTIEATGRLRASDVTAEAEAVLMALFHAWAAGD